MNITQYWWCVRILRQAYKSKLITGLPASAVAAQAVIETWYGYSEPYDKETGKRSYNLFCVKAYPDKGLVGPNGYVTCYTHEEIDGEMELKLLHFRAYHSHKESFNDHARILAVSKKNGEQRYRKAFDHLDDAEAFITEVWKAGYASDSNYVKNIIPIIRTLNKIPIWVLKL
jgi:flagellar protein FlgJ